MEEKLVRYVDNRVAAELQPQLALAQVTVPKWVPFVGKLKPIPVGWHGYANLTFKEDSLTIEYHSLAGEQDVLEHFLLRRPECLNQWHQSVAPD
jgi:hypothetical protein